MPDSVYKIINLVGTSTTSWEEAAKVAVERASQSLRDLRVAEVVKLDMKVEDGKVTAYRARIQVSFKYTLIISITPLRQHLLSSRPINTSSVLSVTRTIPWPMCLPESS